MDFITLEDTLKEVPTDNTYVSTPYIPITPNAGENVVTSKNGKDNVIISMAENDSEKNEKPYILPTVLTILGVYVAYKTLI